MKRYIKSANTILYPDITDLMLIEFDNEYSSLNDYGRKLFDEQYPGWNNTENIRKYFYNAFEIENSIKSLFRAADRKDVEELQRCLTDFEYLGYEYSHAQWLAKKLLTAIR